jgi:hypothetical protein
MSKPDLTLFYSLNDVSTTVLSNVGSWQNQIIEIPCYKDLQLTTNVAKLISQINYKDTPNNVINLSSTTYFFNEGTITTQNVLPNNYSLESGQLAIERITSGTKDFLSSTGYVSIYGISDNLRVAYFWFNK